MRSRLLSGAATLVLGKPAGAAAFKLLFLEIITTPGSFSRNNTYGASILVARAIGGGAGSGRYSGTSSAPGAAGACEGIGTFFVNSATTVTGEVGRGGDKATGTSVAPIPGGDTSINVGSVTIIGGGGVPGDNSGNGGISVLGSTQSGQDGFSIAGGRRGGNGSNSGITGAGGRGAGTYGGAGGTRSGGLDGTAPGGSAAGFTASAANVPATTGAGGHGGAILEWWG